MTKYFIFCFVILCSSVIELSGQTQNSKMSNPHFNMPIGIHQEQYLPKTIIFRLKYQYKKNSKKGDVSGIAGLNDFFQKQMLQCAYLIKRLIKRFLAQSFWVQESHN